MKYIGIDGDDIGAKLELFLLENNENKVKLLSQEVDLSISNIAQEIEEIGMQIIFCSGDSLLCKGEQVSLDKLSRIIKKNGNGINFSAGVGCTIKNAYIALKYAKASGKNKLVVLENDQYVIM